jgi:protein-S-isoprenylcysteine O-methyltransferase Ste14
MSLRTNARGEVTAMFVLARALVYATLFVGLLLVFVPARVLSSVGVRPPPAFGIAQTAGVLLAVTGAVLALSCVLAFATIGRGTPAPFDPPRRLVTRGPYAFVRNPMYLGAGTALAGAALYYRSFSLLTYTVAFMLAAHLFVITYEERALRAKFKDEYVSYCARVRRWLPSARPEDSRRISVGKGENR